MLYHILFYTLNTKSYCKSFLNVCKKNRENDYLLIKSVIKEFYVICEQ